MQNLESVIEKNATKNENVNVAEKAPLLVNVNKAKALEAKKEKAPKAPKVKKDVAPKANDLLSKMNAIGLTEKVKQASAQRSVFKKEFNNKSDRTKCRTKFFNAIELCIIFLSKGNKEKAKEEYKKASEIAKMYYSAEDKFNVYSDYCTENNEKKESVKLFIETISDKKYKSIFA